MKNGLSRYSGILLVGIFVLSIFSIWLYEVNCGEGSPPQPPSPPPPCTVCCNCTTGQTCCNGQCCAQANCCGNECHASAQYPCGATCCDVPDTGPYSCCGDIPCCAGECCVKITESPDPESDSGGTIKEYSYNCCSGGNKYCCNEKCSECKTSAYCIEKYGLSCYKCRPKDKDSPCKCVKPDHENYQWDYPTQSTILRYWRHATHTLYWSDGSTPPGCFVEEQLTYVSGYTHGGDEETNYTDAQGKFPDYLACPGGQDSRWRQVLLGDGCYIGAYFLNYEWDEDTLTGEITKS